MKIEDVIKHWDVIEAFKEGKQIEWFSEIDEKWAYTKEPEFHGHYKYRIKEEPKYIPFDFSDAQKLIGKIIIKDDSTSVLHMIVSIDDDGVVFYDDHFSFKELFELYKFLNGSICGKLCQ